ALWCRLSIAPCGMREEPGTGVARERFSSTHLQDSFGKYAFGGEGKPASDGCMEAQLRRVGWRRGPGLRNSDPFKGLPPGLTWVGNSGIVWKTFLFPRWQRQRI